jgi:hypothetical protein
MSWAAPPRGKSVPTIKKIAEIAIAVPDSLRIPEHKHRGGMFKVQGRAKRMFKVQSSRFKVQSSGFRVQKRGGFNVEHRTLNIERRMPLRLTWPGWCLS